MAVKEENKRISLTLSKELDEKIDRLAGLQNISKNATIVNLIEMSIDAQINFWNIMKDPQLFSKLVDMTSKFGDEESKKALSDVTGILKSDNQEDIENIQKLTEVFNGFKK